MNEDEDGSGVMMLLKLKMRLSFFGDSSCLCSRLSAQ